MRIHLILSMGSLMIMTIIPIVMYFKRWNKAINIALLTAWILAVVTVYIYLSVIFMIAD
ncbi:hypothetical protein HOF56_02305 [Candidatus Peribacteria bacterium]|nr:hypothetical protein [Candidatus Peribacteria bacterium]MBT4021569.1 hypothetical protein [Candidatus Peribacteria bacterium]MBT4240577.1 hypothetical protein [Candidatus Peribacteria bacterium]MBT4474688.1 hypothetical protein [Candidatus Peribacteria bacterium]